jgi:hypoxanthine phosphoribosyltransferase
MGPTSMAPDELGSLKEPKKQYFSWNTYHNLVLDLHKKIDWKPDIIVSIGKGGSIPGVILAENFNTNNLNFGVKSYSKYDRNNIVEYQSVPCYKSLRGMKVLIVDDLADSGETFIYVLNKFKQNFVDSVKTASVFKKTKSKFVPDFYAEEIHCDTWIVQPWE